MCAGSEKCAGFRQVTLLGLGVMGSSLGLALKKLTHPPTVIGCSRRGQTRVAAADRGVADRICECPTEAVTGSDLVVGCLPILALPPAFRAVLPALGDDTVLTDVGSTKQWLDQEIRALLHDSNCLYIGSHPMTGTEKSGPDAACANLYRNATVFLTPAPSDDPEKVRRLERFWQAVGARVHRVTPEDHDRRAARTSHLPHMAAAALVAVALRDDAAGLKTFIGPGFRDTTRIAAGSPDVWHDIVRTNGKALTEELEALQSELQTVCRWVRNKQFEDVRGFLERARDGRRREVP